MLFNDHYLKKLNQQLKQCSGCAIKKDGKGPVGGHGALDADVMFVSVMPGEEEARTGIPFTGTSRHLFKQCIENSGFKDGEYYATYLLKCMRGDNPPGELDFKKCIEFLLMEIDIIKPRIICTMGYHVSKYLLDYFKYEDRFTTAEKIHGYGLLIPEVKKRKKVVRHKMYVIPTYNPASKDSVMNERMLTDVKTIKEIKRLSTLLFD